MPDVWNTYKNDKHYIFINNVFSLAAIKEL